MPGTDKNNAVSLERYKSVSQPIPEGVQITVLALIEAGDTYSQIATKTGIAKSSIARIKKRHLEVKAKTGEVVKPGQSRDLAVIKEGLATACEDKSSLLINAITPEKAAKTGIKDLAIASGILIEKSRLIRGESTSNVDLMGRILIGARTPNDNES